MTALTHGPGWFRIFGYGVCHRDHRKSLPLFAERHGYVRRLHVGPHCFELLRPRGMVPAVDGTGHKLRRATDRDRTDGERLAGQLNSDARRALTHRASAPSPSAPEGGVHHHGRTF